MYLEDNLGTDILYSREEKSKLNIRNLWLYVFTDIAFSGRNGFTNLTSEDNFNNL